MIYDTENAQGEEPQPEYRCQGGSALYNSAIGAGAHGHASVCVTISTTLCFPSQGSFSKSVKIEIIFP